MKIFTLLFLIIIGTAVYFTDTMIHGKSAHKYELKAVDGTQISFISTNTYYVNDTVSLYKFYDGENIYEWMIDKENPKLCNSTYISHEILCYRTFGVIIDK